MLFGLGKGFVDSLGDLLEGEGLDEGRAVHNTVGVCTTPRPTPSW